MDAAWFTVFFGGKAVLHIGTCLYGVESNRLRKGQHLQSHRRDHEPGAHLHVEFSQGAITDMMSFC